MNSIYLSKPWVTQYKPSSIVPIPQWSMIEAFQLTASNAPNAPAIYHFDHIISFSELDNSANRFAALLASWGIGKGDRVAISLQNDPEFAVVQLGTWKRGAILVPLNPMFKEREIAYHLADSGTRVWIVLSADYAEQARAWGGQRVATSGDML